MKKGTIRRFEDIQAWQRGRVLACSIYGVTSQRGFAKDFILRDQIRRAAVSIISNIAEGFARKSPKEFSNFLSVARGSAAEMQAQLYIAMDLGYISESQFRDLYAETEETSKMLQGFINYLNAAGMPVPAKQARSSNSQLATRNS